MEKLPQYVEMIEQGRELVNNHTNVLKSLLLSRQNANNNVYTEATNGITDGAVESGEGISSAGDGTSA